jgi:AAA+ superfamily predicted ATPase
MYGPPGTGKTMMARACAGQTKACFLKLAGPNLVQMYIGDGPKMVRDAFALAKEKQPTIIFIDEIDAVGTKRFDNDKSGDREVQRTMLELLNHLDGYFSFNNLVFRPTMISKFCVLPIGLTSLTPRLCDQADWIGRLSSLFPRRMLESRS